jgi:hypothetical protein
MYEVFSQKGAVTMDPITDALAETETIGSEDFFHRSLVLERKKTERSGRPFLLIFLEVGPLLQESTRPGETVLDTLSRALNASTRDIDVKGWYRQDSLLGIICTDVSTDDSAQVIVKIKNKLDAHLGPDEAHKIIMHTAHYPDYEIQFDMKSFPQVIKELQPERKGVFFS